MSHQNCSFLSAVLKSGLAVPLLCHPPLSWGSDTQLLQQQGKLPQARLTEEQNN